MNATSMTFREALLARRSPRAFQSDPIDPEVIRGVLQDAQTAPSNSNTQPWAVHVVSGSARDALSTALLVDHDAGRRSLDFTDGYGDGIYLERAQRLAEAHYGLRGIPRSDHAGRNEVIRENLRFYGAPHVALLFMPQLGDGVRTAGDIGMYAQTFLLSLAARGAHGIPQTILGMYADTVRQALHVPSELKLLFGISFGFAKPDSPLKALTLDKVSLEESVTLHDTPGVL